MNMKKSMKAKEGNWEKIKEQYLDIHQLKIVLGLMSFLNQLERNF